MSGPEISREVRLGQKAETASHAVHHHAELCKGVDLFRLLQHCATPSESCSKSTFKIRSLDPRRPHVVSTRTTGRLPCRAAFPNRGRHLDDRSILRIAGKSWSL
jgi:hypothetical protein